MKMTRESPPPAAHHCALRASGLGNRTLLRRSHLQILLPNARHIVHPESFSGSPDLMCGIAGFSGFGDRDILRRMTDAIRHRGPDAEGHWAEEDAGIFFGHRRLAIVDLSGGAQPMWTADAAIGVTFNGEIYNHAELR